MRLECPLRFRVISIMLLVNLAPQSLAQETAKPAADPSLAEAVKQLQEQVNELRSVVTELRSESARYRSETESLREELHSATAKLSQPEPRENAGVQQGAAGQPSGAEEGKESSVVSDRLAKLEEEYELLTGKVNDQFQTKVESASKYRLRVSGLVLLNTFTNRGG